MMTGSLKGFPTEDEYVRLSFKINGIFSYTLTIRDCISKFQKGKASYDDTHITGFRLREDLRKTYLPLDTYIF